MASPGTLGELAEAGLKLRVWCNLPRCRHYAEIDPHTLIPRLGGDRLIYGVWEDLKCSRCGASGKRKGDIFAMPEWPGKPMGFSRDR